MNAPDDADGSDGAPPENLGERSGALLAALESVDAAIEGEYEVGIYDDVTTFARTFLEADRDSLRETLGEAET